jgi:sRNA-binding protein
VSQISPPIRIVLAAAAIFLVAWMTLLRPKSDAVTVPPAATPAGNLATGQAAVSAPGKLAEKAKAAAENSAANQEQHAGEETTGAGTATAPATTKAAGSATAASDDTKGLPKPVARAIARNQALVLVFFNHKASVDRAVKHSVAKVDRWGGKVFVKAVPISKVGRYARITGGAGVDQTPSVVVVDRDLKATTLAGFTDTKSVDQLVIDALRNSGGLFSSAYLRDVNAVCSRYDRGFITIVEPNDTTEVPRYVRTSSRTWAGFESSLRGVKAPKRYAGFRKAVLADVSAQGAIFADWASALGKHPSAAKIASSGATYSKRSKPISKRLEKRMDAKHLVSCSG